MMKMHFEAFAAEIKRTMKGKVACKAADLVANVASEFNPRFDRSRFYIACGVLG